MNRRDFLTRLPVAGAAIPLAAHSVLNGMWSSEASSQIENEFLTVIFNESDGSLNIARSGGEKLVTNVITRAVLDNGRRTTRQKQYRRSCETSVVKDVFGNGRELRIRSVDGETLLDFELRLILYEKRSALSIQAFCKNTSGKTLILQSIEAFCAVPEEGGALYWPQSSKLLTNGPMYYDAGMVVDFAEPETEFRRSWWNIGLFRGYEQEGLSFGSIENNSAQGQVVVRRESGNAVSLIAESLLAKGYELKAGQTVRSNRFMLNIAPGPYQALEEYAAAMGTWQQARTHSVLNGWCNWFFTYEHITEVEFLHNAAFAAQVLKPYGFEYVQIDEGFQTWHGDWEGNSRFPHGMKWLADQVRALGLKPGIWIAPYVISEPSEVFQKHPEWLIKHPDGRLKRVGPWPSEDTDWARHENPKRYGLDITHPGAAQWLFDLFDTIANKWGFEMIKIDFVDWSLLSAHHYYDRSVSRAEAYRRGFEIIRKAVGLNCHLQECGPASVTVGLSDSMRIELDQNYGYPPEVWKQYFLNSSSSAPAAAKRYYFHKRTWINDADHVCLNLLSPSQAQAAATLLALTGGNILSGDRLPDLDATRLEILKKILPSFGEAAKPVDLFDTDRHSIFALTIRKPFGTWTLLGFFNSSETEPLDRVVALDRCWLDPQKTYLAYDFWKERYIGEIQGNIKVRVPMAGVVLLALHEKLERPQVLSTDRHVLQGAVELEDVSWDPDTGILQGVSLGPAGTSHNVAVYVPDARRWTQGGTFLHHDFTGYTLKMMEEHILRVHVRFDNENRTAWKIDFNAFFKS